MIKKSISALLCTALVFSVVGCSKTDNTNKNDNNSAVVENNTEESKDVSVKDLVASVVDAGYIRMPAEIDETTAKDMYHVNLEDVEEYAIAETMISPGPGFMMAVKAKEGKLDAVKSALEQVKADKVGKAFYPEEAEIASKAEVKTVGNIVYLTLFNSEVTEEAEALIESSLNK